MHTFVHTHVHVHVQCAMYVNVIINLIWTPAYLEGEGLGGSYCTLHLVMSTFFILPTFMVV